MIRRGSAYVEAKPGVCGGKPRIAGSRIRVQDVVVWHELQGQSADEIVRGHPTITQAGVHAALAYYFEHQREINRDIRQDRVLVERMHANWIREKTRDTESGIPHHEPL